MAAYQGNLLFPSPLHVPVAMAESRLFSSLNVPTSSSGFTRVCMKMRPEGSDFCCRSDQGLSQNTLTIQWDKVSKVDKDHEGALKVYDQNAINQWINIIKTKLQSIEDSEVSISAYDTAWVAVVKDIHGFDAPQFPSSLEWIGRNQLVDGSWGDQDFFSAYDRLSNTLACVVALTTWNLYPEKCAKGMRFIQQNFHKLNDEDPEHMLSGFEVRFPALIEMAENLGLEFNQESHVLQDLYATREQKLKRIPKEMLHTRPTTLLYSLEGVPGLDWERLLKLQHPNGSFLCSPASTAFALKHTKDEKCLKYLVDIVERFNGGVPHSYPMDLFERLWVVDRLERLGISRHFNSEIKDCLDYVYRYWTPKGISWSRDTVEFDIDDTSMGFRILRQHGYKVSADVFKYFEKEGQFFCFLGQTNQGVTEMLSLYRASQMLLPGEKILEQAKMFTSNFLREKQDLGQVADRWIISKDLPGEVQYNLECPWYGNLPRIETRYYIDQYGGDNDVWIAKVLNRMYNISNNQYLELAKLDYNHCQQLHQWEWNDIQRWYKECNLKEFGLSKNGLLKAYFLAMSCKFEPDQAVERLAWAKTTALLEAISFYFNEKAVTVEQKGAFFKAFSDCIGNRLGSKSFANRLVKVVYKTLNDITLKVREVHKKDILQNLKHVWDAWLMKCKVPEDGHLIIKDEAELLVHTINLCSARPSFSIDRISQPEFIHLTNLTNKIVNHLRQTRNKEIVITRATEPIEVSMQELVQHVVKSDDGLIDSDMKQVFMTVAKSFYYSAYCEPTIINLHISKVLFERVI